jgi:hypothetical protein
MGKIFHLIASEPLAIGVVGLCLLFVVALFLSDWAEKRRERQLILARARLRNSSLRHDGLLAHDPAISRALRANRPVFRLFRWELLLVSIAFVGLWAPMSHPETGALHVAAREPEPAARPIGTQSEPPSGSSLQLPSLSFMIPADIACAVLDYRIGDSPDPTVLWREQSVRVVALPVLLSRIESDLAEGGIPGPLPMPGTRDVRFPQWPAMQPF